MKPNTLKHTFLPFGFLKGEKKDSCVAVETKKASLIITVGLIFKAKMNITAFCESIAKALEKTWKQSQQVKQHIYLI